MKKIMIGMFVICLMSSTQFVNFTGKPIPTSIKKAKLFSDYYFKNIIPTANAGATENNLRDVVKILYYTIAGFPDAAKKEALYWALTSQHAPYPTEIGGMVTGIGDTSTAIDSIFNQNGIQSCGAIPNTGTYAGTYSGSSISLALGSSSKIKPVGYPGAGQAYAKRVQLTVDGALDSYIEFDCSRRAGWLYTYNAVDHRKMELYYDLEDSSNSRVEFFMDVTDGVGDAYTYVKLLTKANNVYDLDIIQAMQLGAGDFFGQRFIVSGDWATKVTKVMGFQAPTNQATMAAVASYAVGGGANVKDANSTAVTLAESFCIAADETTTTKGTVTGCEALTLADRSGETPAIDATGAITIQWVAGATGLKAKMSSF